MCPISSYFISLSTNFFIKVVMGPAFGNFLKDYKFFDTFPNKRWGLCSLLLNLSNTLTTSGNGVWRDQCFVIPEPKS